MFHQIINNKYLTINILENCDSLTGECYKCLNNTDGDKCQHCRAGYYGDAITKKDCQDCGCDACGSEVAPCNRTSGQCQCKPNVEGVECNKCKVSSCYPASTQSQYNVFTTSFQRPYNVVLTSCAGWEESSKFWNLILCERNHVVGQIL